MQPNMLSYEQSDSYSPGLYLFSCLFLLYHSNLPSLIFFKIFIEAQHLIIFIYVQLHLMLWNGHKISNYSLHCSSYKLFPHPPAFSLLEENRKKL